MSGRLLLSVFLTSLLLGCAKDEGITFAPPDAITDAEYTVLATIVDLTVVGSSQPVLVLDDSTSCGVSPNNADSSLTKMLQYVGQNISALKPETSLDFKSKNLVRTPIIAPASIDPRCVRSSETNVHFPFLSVSRVGFSTDNQQALAYVASVYGPLAGSGNFYLLARQGLGWKITASVMIWIS